MFFVITGWVVFRSENISFAWEYLKTMFGIGASIILDSQAISYLQNYGVYLLTGIIFCFPIVSLIKKKIYISKKVLYILVFLLFVVSISFTIKGSYNPFIYFNF